MLKACFGWLVFSTGNYLPQFFIFAGGDFPESEFGAQSKLEPLEAAGKKGGDFPTRGPATQSNYNSSYC